MARCDCGERPATCGVITTFGCASKFGGHVGLALHNVERRARDAALAQRVDQRRGVDQRAARDVDQEPGRPERLEHGRVDQVARLGAARRRHHQHVGVPGELERARVVGVGHVGAGAAVVVADAHREAADAAPHDLVADHPEAEHAEPHAGEFRAREGRVAPLAPTHRGVAVPHAANHAEHQRQRVVRHRRRVGALPVGDDEAARARRRHVHAPRSRRPCTTRWRAPAARRSPRRTIRSSRWVVSTPRIACARSASTSASRSGCEPSCTVATSASRARAGAVREFRTSRSGLSSRTEAPFLHDAVRTTTTTVDGSSICSLNRTNIRLNDRGDDHVRPPSRLQHARGARRRGARRRNGRARHADLPDHLVRVRRRRPCGVAVRPAGVRQHLHAARQPDQRGARGACRGAWRGAPRRSRSRPATRPSSWSCTR